LRCLRCEIRPEFPRPPSATLPTTNPTWTDPGANPGLHGERPVTNDLSHGMARIHHLPSFSAVYHSKSTFPSDTHLHNFHILITHRPPPPDYTP
jgi:hypothetical protein